MTPPAEVLNLPDHREFRRWVRGMLRPVVGWVLAGLGALSLLLGWYGVSGQSLTAKQLPYLVSGGLTGIALVVLAAAFLATDDFRRQLHRLDDLEHKVNDLYTLLTTDPAATDAGTAVVALPSGTSFHRKACALTAGKANAVVVDARVIRARGLRACKVCDPEPPAADAGG